MVSGIGVTYRISPGDETTRQLLRQYVSRRRDERAVLHAAIAEGDYALLRRIGHNLSGSGSAYGLVRISKIGAEIERAAERSAVTELRECVAELGRFLASIEIV